MLSYFGFSFYRSSSITKSAQSSTHALTFIATFDMSRIGNFYIGRLRGKHSSRSNWNVPWPWRRYARIDYDLIKVSLVHIVSRSGLGKSLQNVSIRIGRL